MSKIRRWIIHDSIYIVYSDSKNVFLMWICNQGTQIMVSYVYPPREQFGAPLVWWFGVAVRKD